MSGWRGTYWIVILLFLSSCTGSKSDYSENPVARVYDEYLYPSDLKNQIPAGLSRDDSIRISRRLTEEWINNRLLLRQAEIQLPEKMKDVEKQVEEYRTSLLIFKYKQSLLSRNLDSTITRSQIESYYKDNSSNYVLEDDIVQTTFLKIPASAPRINEVRQWYRSDNPNQLASLEKYCSEYAEHYSLNDTIWVHFNDLMEKTPLKIDNSTTFLNYNRFIETNDSNFYFFIRINNRKKEGEIKPLSMVQKNIKTVLLNKRKIEYLQDLENSVYREGMGRNQVEIYK